MRNCCDTPFSGIHLALLSSHQMIACRHTSVQPQFGSLPPWPQEASDSAFCYLWAALRFQRCSALWNVGMILQPGAASQTQKILFLQPQILKAMTKLSPLWPEELVYVVHWGHRGHSGSELCIEMTELFINFKRKNEGFHKSTEATSTGN